MKQVTIRFVREGDVGSVLERKRDYLAIIDEGQPRDFRPQINHEECVHYLTALRYKREDGTEAESQEAEAARQEALDTLTQKVTDILRLAPLPEERPLHLDLVTSFRELWVLPFEAVSDTDEEPLLTKSDRPVVLTRRIPPKESQDEVPPQWPARPRVLFAYAKPEWVEGPEVPAQEHKEALQEVLRPWFEPIPLSESEPVLGDERTVLTTLEEATLEQIRAACRDAAQEEKPYTHVHILAHGQEVRDKFADYYGIGLCASDELPTKPAELVAALKPPPEPGKPPQQTPVVVTLAACDGANIISSFLEVGSLAHALHEAGVPIVVASQLPLTFPGSEIVTRTFYDAWLNGQDVRRGLYKTRRALYEKAEEAGHDWVSLVTYANLPKAYNQYLLEVRLQTQLAALETTSNHAKELLDRGINEDWQYGLVTQRLQERIDVLYDLLQEQDMAAYKSRQIVFQEHTGLLGSAHKRLAELFKDRAEAAADPESRKQWYDQSREAFDKASEVYLESFRHTGGHWTGVQALVLETIVRGKSTNLQAWFTCLSASQKTRNYSTDEKDKIWALGSLAELAMLAPLVEGAPLTYNAADFVNELRREVEEKSKLFPDLSPITSTRRQFRRYVTWWTKANGFFEDRETDLAEEAEALAQLLDDQ